MRSLAFAVAAGLLFAAAPQSHAATMPVGGLKGAADVLSDIDQVRTRVYVYRGQRYCFAFDGWRGPGWYRCGFAHRRGLGWGGVYGWNRWHYAPYERRFGGRIGVQTQTQSRTGVQSRTQTRTGVETRSRTTVQQRSGSTIKERTTAKGGAIKQRQTTGDGGVQVRGGAKVEGGAQMKDGPDVKARGGGKVEGGQR
jgi:hypothetical protein